MYLKRGGSIDRKSICRTHSSNSIWHLFESFDERYQGVVRLIETAEKQIQHMRPPQVLLFEFMFELRKWHMSKKARSFLQNGSTPAMTDSITETDERRFATEGSTERPRAERPALDLSSPYFFIISKTTYLYSIKCHFRSSNKSTWGGRIRRIRFSADSNSWTTRSLTDRMIRTSVQIDSM